mgnify:CR=1 FL=1
MSLTATVISPIEVILTSADGLATALLTYNVTTGVVTSAVLPSTTTTFLTQRLQQLIASVPALATATFVPKMLRSMLLIDSAAVGGTVTESNAVVSGSSWALTLTVAINSQAFVGLAHSINQPFVVNAPPPAGGMMFALSAPQCENATRFLSIGTTGAGAPDAGDEFIAMPVAGTITSMQIKLCTVQMSAVANATLTFTARKATGGLGVPADTTMVVLFTGPANGNTLAYGIDDTHPFTVAKGDLVSVKFVDTNLGNNGGRMTAVLYLVPS